MTIPYFAQETDFTCGPACLRMLLAACGITESEKTLARKASANEDVGTSSRTMCSLLSSYGIPARLTRRMHLKDLQRLLQQGIPVIVNYREPSENIGHYAVATGMNGQRLTLADPCNGKNFTIPVSEFQKRWYGHNSPIKTAGRGIIPTAWQGKKVQ